MFASFRLRRAALAAIVGLSLSVSSFAKEIDPRPDAPVVQVALLLDTSNSMDGLINQARTQLWKIVNQFNNTRQDGKQPRIQVALYEYGNNSLDASGGYIRQVLPLTTDLDLVSEKLWSLKTNGGDEYCGQVISKATSELDWTNNKRAYQAIFIAGNEPFSQGSYDYHRATAEAIGRGVVVNTIHCGPENIGRETGWAEGARIGEGKFLNIDQDRACVITRTPQDDEIQKLSSKLNDTYIPYGHRGAEGKQRQDAQDSNAASAPASGGAIERALSKSSSNYSNSKWDLVDAIKDKSVVIEDVKEVDLPENMQKMNKEERRNYVESQQAKRDEIQKQINELSKAREKYIADEEKKQSGTAGADTYDSAVMKAMKEQMEAKEFKTN